MVGCLNNYIPRERIPTQPVSVLVDEFYGLIGILKTSADYEDRIPKEMIPIARDGDGNLLLITLSGSKAGQIYFWDHEMEPKAFRLLGLVFGNTNLIKLADTFSSFLELLEPTPGAEDA